MARGWLSVRVFAYKSGGWDRQRVNCPAMERLPQVLICDDDSVFHLAVKHSLKGKYECKSAYNSDEAVAILKNSPFEILLLDIQMRTPDEGLRALPQLREMEPELGIIITSGLTDFATVREAMRLGATDYVPKDFNPDDLAHSIARVLERRRILRRRDQQEFEVAASQKKHVLIGESPPIRQLRKTIEKMRHSGANVLITGETGTGKEVVARQLRRTLPDGSLAPFVAVDSSTIQSTTAESTLFGHEKGAFTGADRTTKGVFEEADGGVVYFDEIGNMPLDIQAKLLRVLQEKEVSRLGSSKVMQLEFRVVCATNKDLEAMARAGTFKDDLLQRLNVLPVQLVPLRERREDIPLLVEHFLSRERSKLVFTPEAVETLKAFPWPGNIRELGNVVSYLVAMTDGNEVDVADLPPKFRDASRPTATDGGGFYDRVSGFEKTLLAQEYARCDGNVSRLALQLGMDRSHLHSKLKEYGIHASRPTKSD
jgi:DNA-binding NtrC family response regulator